MFEITPTEIEQYLLVFVRVATIIAVFPIFGQSQVPVHARIGLSLFLCLIIAPLVVDPSKPAVERVLPLALNAAGEASVGLIIGFVARFIFWGVQQAGQLVSFQMGFGLARIIDAQAEQEIPILSRFYFVIAMLIFLAVRGHHFLLEGLSESFRFISIGEARFGKAVVEEVMTMGGEVFRVGLKISAPVLVSLFLTDAALGLVARTVPQMNIFIVGLPVKIGVGFIMMGLTLVLFLGLFERLVGELQRDMLTVLRTL